MNPRRVFTHQECKCLNLGVCSSGGGSIISAEFNAIFSGRCMAVFVLVLVGFVVIVLADDVVIIHIWWYLLIIVVAPLRVDVEV